MIKSKSLVPYIKKTLHGFLEYEDKYKEVIPFVKKVHNYKDDNGELHCTSYALYYSRCKKTLYETFLFTDDDGAIGDFEDFFKINSIGSILTTIDLLNILYRKENIPKKAVLNFAENLKKLYISDFNELSKLAHEATASKGIKSRESALLTEIREQLDSIKFDEIKKLISHRSSIYKKIKKHNKKFDELLNKVINLDYKKIKTLDEKIKQLEKIW